MKFFEAMKWDGEPVMLPPDSVIHFEEIAPGGIAQAPGATTIMIYDLGQGPKHCPLKEQLRYLEAIILRGPRANTFIKLTFAEGNVLYTKKELIKGIEGMKQETLPDKPGEEVPVTARTKVTIALLGTAVCIGVMEEPTAIQEAIGAEVESRPEE